MHRLNHRHALLSIGWDPTVVLLAGGGSQAKKRPRERGLFSGLNKDFYSGLTQLLIDAISVPPSVQR